MAQIFSTSRAEAALFRFPPLFFPLTTVLAIVLQAYLPVVVRPAVHLDLPLLIVIYFSLNSRNQITSSLLGASLGMIEDSIAHMALGLNGIAKTMVGFFAASVGGKLDADHGGIRLLLVVASCYFNSAVLYLFKRFLIAAPEPWLWSTVLFAGVLNAAVALVAFQIFDRFRSRI